MNAIYFLTDAVVHGDRCAVCKAQLPYGSYRCTACTKTMCSARCRDAHDEGHTDLEPGPPIVPRMAERDRIR